MIAFAAIVGAVCGLAVIFTMYHNGMLAERSGAAILLSAIAVFYPVFAVISGDILALVLHLAIFAGFSALAMRGFHQGLHLIAGGLIAHGLFDLGVMFIHITGPTWWPAFCAGVDIFAGAALLRLIQTGKATP